MGGGYQSPSDAERAFLRRRYRQEQIRASQIVQKRKMTVATRIADRIIGKINCDIIRPGPKSEERECTAMAQELINLRPELIDTIFTALGKKEEESAKRVKETQQ